MRTFIAMNLGKRSNSFALISTQQRRCQKSMVSRSALSSSRATSSMWTTSGSAAKRGSLPCAPTRSTGFGKLIQRKMNRCGNASTAASMRTFPSAGRTHTAWRIFPMTRNFHSAFPQAASCVLTAPPNCSSTA